MSNANCDDPMLGWVFKAEARAKERNIDFWRAHGEIKAEESRELIAFVWGRTGLIGKTTILPLALVGVGMNACIFGPLWAIGYATNTRFWKTWVWKDESNETT